MGGLAEPAPSLRVKFVAISVFSWFLLGFVSNVVIAVYNFIPSAEWVAETNLLRIIVCSLSTALFAWFAWKAGKLAQMSRVKRILGVVGSPLMGYFMVGNIVFIWPMLLPMVAGHEDALPFTALRATDRGAKNCHYPVKLEGMPFLVDRVCNVPESIRSTLSPGSRIVVRGWGTRLGVYAREVRLADVNGPRF